MIISRFNGGLGNQMFCYAAGRALALRHGVDLKLDIRHYPDGIGRDYELHHFPIHISGLACWEDVKCREWREPTLPGRVIKKITGKPLKREHAEDYLNDTDTICRYHPRFETLGPNAFLNGYWQSEKYFADITDTIRHELGAPKSLGPVVRELANKIAACDCPVSLHVRRGDYVANPQTTAFHGVCPVEYYQQAVRKLLSQHPKAHLFLFSDEPDWVAENLKLEAPSTMMHDGNTGVDDLWLMSRCRHHIIANSSFSWWGAWLNPDPDKLVIAPKQWFVDPAMDTTDLIPEGWERM